MLTNLLLDAGNAAASTEGAQDGNIFAMLFGNPLVLMLVIFVIFYFFMIKPQQKRQKEIRNFQNSLAEGTTVFTQGGIYGTVKKIDLANNIVEVEIAKGIVIRVNKNFVFKDDASAQTK